MYKVVDKVERSRRSEMYLGIRTSRTADSDVGIYWNGENLGRNWFGPLSRIKNCSVHVDLEGYYIYTQEAISIDSWIYEHCAH